MQIYIINCVFVFYIILWCGWDSFKITLNYRGCIIEPSIIIYIAPFHFPCVGSSEEEILKKQKCGIEAYLYYPGNKVIIPYLGTKTETSLLIIWCICCCSVVTISTLKSMSMWCERKCTSLQGLHYIFYFEYVQYRENNVMIFNLSIV